MLHVTQKINILSPGGPAAESKITDGRAGMLHWQYVSHRGRPREAVQKDAGGLVDERAFLAAAEIEKDLTVCAGSRD